MQADFVGEILYFIRCYYQILKTRLSVDRWSFLSSLNCRLKRENETEKRIFIVVTFCFKDKDNQWNEQVFWPWKNFFWQVNFDF